MIRGPPIVCKAAVQWFDLLVKLMKFLDPEFPDLKYQCPNSRPILKLVPIWQFSVFPGEEGGEDSLWFLLPTPHAARGFLIKWNERRPRWGHFTLQLYFMSLECEHCPDVQPQSTNSPFGTWYAPDSQDALSKRKEQKLCSTENRKDALYQIQSHEWQFLETHNWYVLNARPLRLYDITPNACKGRESWNWRESIVENHERSRECRISLGRCGVK